MNPIEEHSEYELEKHLQANLHDYAPEAPDRLWAGIEARLPKQRKRPAVWGWLGVLVLLSSLGYGFDAIRKPNSPANAVCSVLSVNQLDYSISVSRPTGAMNKEFLIADSAAFQAVMAAKTSPTTISKKSGAPVDILPAEASQTGTYLAESTKPQRVEILPEKPDTWWRNANPKLTRLLFPVKPAYAQHWQIGIVAAPVWVWQPMAVVEMHHSGQMTFAEHREGPATGWQKGVSVGYKLGANWLLTTGLSQRQTTQTSAHTATLRLMDGTCLNAYDPGPKEYEFQYALQSGLGQSNVTVRIAQVDSGSTMPVDEPFMLDMRTTRHTTDWVLPVTLQRAFSRGRWQAFVQGGGQLNLPARTTIQVDHFTEACVDLCFAGGRIPTLTLAERGKTSVAWLFGTGLNYGIAPHWALSVAPTLAGQKGRMELVWSAGLTLKL